MRDPYFVYRTNNRLIVGWGHTPSGTPPAIEAGQAYVIPPRSDFDEFLEQLETSGFPYRYPNVEGGAYFEAYWQSGGNLAFGFLAGGVPPAGESSPAEKARERRNALLAECDWTQLGDVDLTSGSKSNFATYRQALRDVPQQSGFPDTINWPARPAEQKP